MDQRFKRAEVFWDEFLELVEKRFSHEPAVCDLNPDLIFLLRPDLEFGGDDTASHDSVVQYFWGNVPGWDNDLLSHNSILDAIADFLKDARPAAILVDNNGSSSDVQVYTQSFVQDGEYWKPVDVSFIRVNTRRGRLMRGMDNQIVELDGEACLQVDGGYINIGLFTTMVKWRWADCVVYSYYFRGDEGIVREEPLPFEL